MNRNADQYQSRHTLKNTLKKERTPANLHSHCPGCRVNQAMDIHAYPWARWGASDSSIFRLQNCEDCDAKDCQTCRNLGDSSSCRVEILEVSQSWIFQLTRTPQSVLERTGFHFRQRWNLGQHVSTGALGPPRSKRLVHVSVWSRPRLCLVSSTCARGQLPGSVTCQTPCRPQDKRSTL